MLALSLSTRPASPFAPLLAEPPRRQQAEIAIERGRRPRSAGLTPAVLFSSHHRDESLSAGRVACAMPAYFSQLFLYRPMSLRLPLYFQADGASIRPSRRDSLASACGVEEVPAALHHVEGGTAVVETAIPCFKSVTSPRTRARPLMLTPLVVSSWAAYVEGG